nr:hypothetical protein [Tanacetum cinerariifolium]
MIQAIDESAYKSNLLLRSPTVEICSTGKLYSSFNTVFASISFCTNQLLNLLMLLFLFRGSAAVTNLHGRAESCKAAGTDVESNIQHLPYLGKGKWDRETVTHALHAASNDRRKAVQYILFICRLWDDGFEFESQ